MRTALDLARTAIERKGTARSRDLENAGVPRVQLSRLVSNGELVRVARGLYSMPDRLPVSDEAILVVARRAPHVIVCLLTALRLHNLTTQAPFVIWVGIGQKDRAPKLEWPTLRIVRFTGASLCAGVEYREVDGVDIRVTNVPRTVVDCFKFRNKIGIDVAMEALREAHRNKRASIDDLWHYATVCRVSNVIRPYLEALV